MTEHRPTAYRTRGSGVAWRETSGEIVILDLDSSFYFGLNSTGARLWRTLADGATRSQLVDQLLASGAGDQRTAGEHVDAFLDALADEGLITAA